MATWECAECTAVYSVGAPKCPQCGSVVRVNENTQPPEEGEDMAKITVHGGPSNVAADEKAAAPPADGEAAEAAADAEGSEPPKSGKRDSSRPARRPRSARAADSEE